MSDSPVSPSALKVASTCKGSPADPPEDIVFEDVDFRYVKQTKYEHGRFDPRPCDPDFRPTGTTGVIERTPWGSLLKHDVPAFFIEHARAVTLRRCRVDWKPGKAWEIYSTADLAMIDCTPRE